jgi:hypothetical protein
MTFVPHMKHTNVPPLPVTGTASYMQMMFVPQREHTYGPPLLVMGLALLSSV